MNRDSPQPNPDAPWRVAVVGGGVSGLAAAHRLMELTAASGRTCELTLFEAGPRVGGVMRTRRIGDYLVETGADSFITNKPWAVDLCRRLGLEDQLIPTDNRFRRSLVLRKGKPVPVPEGFMLLSPSKVWPVLTSPIFSPWGKLRLGMEYFLPRGRGDSDESLADFVRRRFGREALERIVQPLVGGIYTSDPEKLSLLATMPRFLDMEREFGSVIRGSRRQPTLQTPSETADSGARYGLFATLNDGVSQLIQSLEHAVGQAATIQLNTAVNSIRRIANRGVYELRFESEPDVEVDAVVIALPTHRAADILAELDTPQSERSEPSTTTDNPLCALLRQIEYASSAIVVSGYKLSQISHPLDAFGLVVPAIENHKVLAVSFSSRKFPGRAPDGHVLLRTFVGGAMQPELLDGSDAEILGIVEAELSDMLGVTGDADFSEVIRYQRAMPQYHIGHLERVEQIERQTAAYPGLALAGNAYRGVGIPDCIHSAEQAVDWLINSVAGPA